MPSNEEKAEGDSVCAMKREHMMRIGGNVDEESDDEEEVGNDQVGNVDE